MMARFDPSAPPFFEVRRGGGPMTDGQRLREEMLERAQERKLRLMDPRTITREELRAAKGLKRISGRTYQERRALGLCQTCEAPSPDHARCEPCRVRYNSRQSRSPEAMRAWRERKDRGVVRVGTLSALVLGSMAVGLGVVASAPAVSLLAVVICAINVVEINR